MSTQDISALIVTRDGVIGRKLDTLLGKQSVSVRSETGTLTGLNGSAVRLAAAHDIVVVDLDGDEEISLGAIEAVSQGRKKGGTIVALADENLPLTRARALAKAGVDHVLPREALDDEFLPQIEAWRARASATLPALWNGQASEGKVIAVSQSRGGLGASTLAVNLATALLGRQGRFQKSATAKVAIVDLDFQFGSVATLLDVEESDALWRMAMDGTVPDATFVEQAMATTSSGLSVLTAPSRFGPLGALQPDQIAATIDALKKSHDYVVVDLPRALVEWIAPVLSRTDRLLLATDVSVASVRAACKLIDFHLGEHPALEIEIVAVREKKPMMMASHHKAAQALLERPFAHWIPDDARTARDAIDRGVPLVDFAPGSGLAKSVRAMAQRIGQALPPRAQALSQN